MSTIPCTSRAISKCRNESRLSPSIIDRLSSFARLLNFTVCDDKIVDVVFPQKDPSGSVTRSSFVASVSDVILKHYQQYVKEDCSLRLLSSDTTLSEEDAQSTRRGLERLFDALDVTGSRRLPGSVLVAMLGLLSQGTIDDRLHYMITVSGKAIGDMVYASSLTPVIEGLFLFIDMLMPTAIYALQVVVSPT